MINYRTRAIISRGLYIFYPISKDHLCTVTFGLMYGLYSRAASNQERLMRARVRYIYHLAICILWGGRVAKSQKRI